MAIKTYKKNDPTKLSANFRAREFDCPGSGCCTQTPVDEKLVTYLQKIRTHFGKPIVILGYRCPAFNAKTPNASPTSRHTKGMAADFSIAGVKPAEIAKYAESIGIQGIGLYDDFVHIDTREQKSFWYSHAQIYRATFGGDGQAQFVRDVQKAIGAKVDGIAGPQTLSKTPTVSRYCNHTHPVVTLLQKRLYALGFRDVGKADGIAGAKFDKAVKAYQRSVGATPDGELTAGKTTWRYILGAEA